MTVSIFVERDSQKGYIATVLEFPNCVAKGKTKEKALKNVKAAMIQKLSHGELVSVQIEPQHAEKSRNPWVDNSGRFKNDPTFDDFLDEIQAYRRELDKEDRIQT